VTNPVELTPGDLARAQKLIDEAALRVRGQFNALEATVAAQTSRGVAFEATQAVALQLQAQGRKFDQTVSMFAEQIGAAKTKYLANAEAGTQAMRSVMGDPTSGSTYNRLAGS
jgi:hypothetical protein